jgi:hypothetical protein
MPLTIIGRIQQEYIPLAGWNKHHNSINSVTLTNPQGLTVTIGNDLGGYQKLHGTTYYRNIIRNDLRAKGFELNELVAGGCAFEPGTY